MSQPVRILLVDDEPLARERIRLLLQGIAGYVVAGEAEDAQEALQELDRCQPDILLLDITMPVMDGIDLLGIIQSTGKNCVAVMLTCHSDFDYARQALRYGAVDYLLKAGLRQEELRAALDRAKNELLCRRVSRRAGEGDRQERTTTQGGYHGSMRTEAQMCLRMIHERYAEDINAVDVAAFAHLSVSWFAAIFRREVGQSFVNYLTNVRINAAKERLRQCSDKISVIAMQVGIEDVAYFHRLFKRYTGMTPLQYRNRAKPGLDS